MSTHDFDFSIHSGHKVDNRGGAVRLNGSDPKIPATLEDDLGTSLIRKVYADWQVDAEWSTWQPRGFTWWGHRYPQRVWSEPGFDDDGFEIYRLCAETGVVKDLPEDVDSETAISGLNAFASMAGLVHLPDERRIVLSTSVYAHEGTASWTGKFLAQSAILQPILAEQLAPILTALLGGEPDERAHPENGDRQEPDEMLGVLDSLYVPQGQGKSAWSGSHEFEQVTEFLNNGNCFATGGPDGLTAEFSFGSRTSMVRVDTRERHPTLGSGVLLRLHLPLNLSPEETVALTGHLNRLERNGGVMSHLLGGWTTDNMGGQHPVFVTFVPTILHQKNLLTNLVFSMGKRAMDMGALLTSEDADCSVVETMLRRLGGDVRDLPEA